MRCIRIPLDFTYREDTPYQLLARRVGHMVATVMSVRLLLLAGEVSPMTGTLVDDPLTLEAKVLWNGRRGAGIEHLELSGYLEKTERGYKVVDWETEHGYLKRFHDRSRKAARARHGLPRILLDGATSNATSNA